ncbi:FKBP-type peptidyl-prolyl cis-trans isomerases 2 [Gynuella sunshinyii YC6258]|uniref:Peptidyl-prolyl cis-trans isomerase n=2 Tax=Gynuella sunshinyii TaxID=1445505 RepID=A0A0C5VCF2_9GAMM|nr:FKBP-type peptidyl-prolyl cis-trans isomerases 2 [Gynuella sunshinyii YC6258]
MIEDNKVVSIHYSVTDENQQVIDSSEGKDPLTYLHGADNIIPGLEKALAGKQTGDSFSAVIPPAEAYGEYNDAMIQQVPMNAFEGVDKVEPGMAFNADGPQGPIQIIVTEVNGDEVTIDGNHPLAGKTLSFDGTVVEVRDATAEEISHGHVH